MLVCWEWLSQYTNLTTTADDLALQFAMSGLNHEGTELVGEDTVIDLEVTSNRSDCLGHIGVAREASVLLSQPLKIPTASPKTISDPASSHISVRNDFVEACPQYTARVIRGVKVGPSPDWLKRRLEAIGIASVNNVVDVTNYVMMECGQPLHAFDLSRLKGNQIVVRPAAKAEKLIAIDHREYELDQQMVVIADAEAPVALGGVMGGAESEVSEKTTDLLIEAAAFTPLSIRRTARKLKLHSPSSFRFERRPDPQGLDWASLRCCDLILEVAGGSLCDGVVIAGTGTESPQPVTLRRRQLKRILGIDIPTERTDTILSQLGCEMAESSSEEVTVVPPSWRGDLTREADLIEEVARIHGYDKIPEDVTVPMTVAQKRPKDIVLSRVRNCLSAAGIDEAMTPSVVPERVDSAGSTWSQRSGLATETSMLQGAKVLRRSILPSLLTAKYENQAQANYDVSLYEVANIYLPRQDAAALPVEQSTLSILTGADLRRLRGVVEEIIAQTCPPNSDVQWSITESEIFESGTAMQVSVGSNVVGFVGEIAGKTRSEFSLQGTLVGAEISLDVLSSNLQEVRTTLNVSPYPAVSRDLNFILSESTNWGELSECCETAGGELLRRVEYRETYRDAKKDGDDTKRILLSLTFQSNERTLTGDEVDRAVQAIVQACKEQHAAKLLG